jgi:hypothetical protein
MGPVDLAAIAAIVHAHDTATPVQATYGAQFHVMCVDTQRGVALLRRIPRGPDRVVRLVELRGYRGIAACT